MFLNQKVVYILFLLSSALVAFGQVVSVDKVKFISLEDDWLQCEVQIRTNRNTMPEAVSDRFINNVGVRLYLGFDNFNNKNIDFYYSDVTAMILERGDKNSVRFYIPGKIMKINRYSKPKYYYSEIVVNNKPLEPSSRAFSNNLQNIDKLNNFIRKAKLEYKKNYGRLMPSYLTPISIVGSDKYAPTYLRNNN